MLTFILSGKKGIAMWSVEEVIGNTVGFLFVLGIIWILWNALGEIVLSDKSLNNSKKPRRR